MTEYLIDSCLLYDQLVIFVTALLNDFIERNRWDWKTLIWQNWKIPHVLISTVCFKRAQQFLISEQTLQKLKATKFLQDLACLGIIILLDVV